MAKTFANVEEAAEAKAAVKEELSAAKEELKAYRKEHSLKKDEDYSQDPKHGKKLEKLQAQITKKEEALANAEAFLKENKPKKAAVVRESKYEYPADVVSASDKKKYRAKMRAEAKAKDKPKKEKPVKEEKAKKEKPVKEVKPEKKKTSAAPAPEPDAD